MYGSKVKEFGDYQTPFAFALNVCKYIKKYVNLFELKAILEPTCGMGNFLLAASSYFSCSNIIGVEINKNYVKYAKKIIPEAEIIEGNIFNLDIASICKEKNILIIGNPPWVTNSELKYNLPIKKNFKDLKGIEALTGSSNFDICEYIILKLINEYQNTDSLICMLCKTTVARNVILEIHRKKIKYEKIEILNFDSNKVFGISATACILIVKLSSYKENNKVIYEVKNFETKKLINTYVVNEGVIKPFKFQNFLEGKSQLKWRQGIKHDCVKIMELECKEDKYINKLKEDVCIEKNLVFPLVKSSHFKKPILHEFFKYVIVTQKELKQDTKYIKYKFPLTWEYLMKHIDKFNNRKSTIYKNTVPFSMFGIGDYSFLPYKVGISGFYKKPLFSLIYFSSDKPVMLDDTSYFLAFDNYDIAYCMMLLLNSKIVREFLLSICFLDNKRPFTIKILSRIDLKKCLENVTFKDIKETEKKLLLSEHVTNIMYKKFGEYIYSLS